VDSFENQNNILEVKQGSKTCYLLFLKVLILFKELMSQKKALKNSELLNI
jgi:hypothetical protein